MFSFSIGLSKLASVPAGGAVTAAAAAGGGATGAGAAPAAGMSPLFIVPKSIFNFNSMLPSQIGV